MSEPGMSGSIPGDVVESSIGQIFQTMYFSDAAYCGAGSIETSVLETAIRFTGDLNGEFRVAVSEILAGQMTADFLAIDAEETSRDQIEAVVGEFANIACGATMSAWRPTASFHYSVPDPLRHTSRAAEIAHCFSISGEDVDLGFEIRTE
jgi:hypothetical protein